MEADKMFIVTVKGQYYAEGKKIRSYEYECKLPNMKKAMSIIKNKIAERKLQNKYEDFVAVRTYAIVDVRTEDGAQAAPDTDNPYQMTLDQLKDAIIENTLPIEIKSYSDIVQLRQDVHDAMENLELFVKNKVERDKNAAEDKALMDLNPDLADEGLQPTEPLTEVVEPALVDGVDPIKIEDPDNPLSGLE